MQLAAKAPLLWMYHDSDRKPEGKGGCKNKCHEQELMSGGLQPGVLTGIDGVPVPKHLHGARQDTGMNCRRATLTHTEILQSEPSP